MAGEEIRPEGSGAIEPYEHAAVEINRMYLDAEAVINEWLDEADQEGAAIIQRARAEAAKAAAEMKVSASEQIASALREADAAATARRQAAADEAANLLAESRAQAQRKLEEAERDAAWRRRQAEADAAAVEARAAEAEAQAAANAAELEARAAANAAAVRDDIGEVHRQLTDLVQRAAALLPVLDAARQLALVESTEAAAPAPVDNDIAEAELVEEPEVVEPEPEPEPVPVHRGLGQLVRDDEPTREEAPLPIIGTTRRRGLGRLLGRR